ncbi:MAG: cytidylate kinase-like family protein [Candidatus Pelethousia sp.]|nr:cytidylate kinase-like family protein [Candidatus Pelethousia sp.]
MKHTIICIGRQYGSGGREIGEKLAQRLKIPCYDKLLVKKTAEQSGLGEAFIQQKEETPANSMWFLSGNPLVDSAGIATAFYSGSQMTYDAERAVIKQLAEKGNCVIVGRCASAILRGQDILSVFVYADEMDRNRRVMQRNGLAAKEANERIRYIDRMRRQYFDFYADAKWGQPESYDLMLSSSRFGINGCVALILAGLEQMKEGGSHE